jgi:hypothetical protein
VRQFKPDPYSEIDGECDYGDDDRVKPHSSPEWSGDRSPGETQPVGTLYGLHATILDDPGQYLRAREG